MPAGNFTLYTRNFGSLNIDDLVAGTVNLALVGSAYTPDIDETTGHHIWADVSANEIAAGNGYAAGGAALATKAKNAIANGFNFDSDNVTFNASGGNIPAWRYGVLYVVGTLWTKTNPLIGYFVGDNTPADIPATLDGNPLNINVPAGGWFDVT